MHRREVVRLVCMRVAERSKRALLESMPAPREGTSRLGKLSKLRDIV